MSKLVDYDNEVFTSWAFYSVILLCKMMLKGIWTTKKRFDKQAFANPEDCPKKGDDKVKPVYGDLDVERVRRCHQNDLENVPLFIFLAFFYVISGPNPFVAIMHFRIFAISRIIYSVVYLMAIPQPARAIAHWVGLFVNGSMAFQVMNYVLNNVKN